MKFVYVEKNIYFCHKISDAMNKEKVIVGLGEVLWDCLPDGMVLGGAPSNCAFHASQYGWRGVVVSAVGHDALGDDVILTLEDRGVEHVIERSNMLTGMVEVQLDADGTPEYDIKRNVAWDAIPYSEDMNLLAQRCDAVCFGSLAQRDERSRATIYRFLDTAQNASLRVFDANLRQHYYSEDIIVASLKRCNVLKINQEEFSVFCEMYGIENKSLRDSCTCMIDSFSLEMLILTCGSDGSYIFSGTDRSYFPTPSVSVQDTVGAGDSFTAAFISAILDGRSVDEAHRLAVSVSSYVCTQRGAMPVWADSLKTQSKKITNNI